LNEATAGQRGLSSCVEAVPRRQIGQDNRAELIDEYTSTESEFTVEELAAARDELYGAKASDAGQAA
jgi:hypothetical protein